MGLTEAIIRGRNWNDRLEKLRNNKVPPQEIGSAIVKLGKPFDQERILAAKDVVATYLNHEDAWVRREAMWFLTSWGRLPEYQPALLHALRHDPDVDNRGYAATCLATLNRGSKNPQVIAALKQALEDNQEDELTRKYAYRSLLEVVKGEPTSDFSPNDHKLSDVNWEWVKSLAAK
jgi:hypothetical protein